jgi:hypothetical protein
MPVAVFPVNPAFLDILTSVNNFTSITIRRGILATDAPGLIAGKNSVLSGRLCPSNQTDTRL